KRLAPASFAPVKFSLLRSTFSRDFPEKSAGWSAVARGSAARTSAPVRSAPKAGAEARGARGRTRQPANPGRGKKESIRPRRIADKRASPGMVEPCPEIHHLARFPHVMDAQDLHPLVEGQHGRGQRARQPFLGREALLLAADQGLARHAEQQRAAE